MYGERRVKALGQAQRNRLARLLTDEQSDRDCAPPDPDPPSEMPPHLALLSLVGWETHGQAKAVACRGTKPVDCRCPFDSPWTFDDR